VQRYKGTKVQRCKGTKAQRYNGVKALDAIEVLAALKETPDFQTLQTLWTLWTFRLYILYGLSTHLLYSSKKSLPLSSVIIKAAMSSTCIFLTASIPISSKSMISTDLIFSSASTAAGPPTEPR
jgi:hypothetical protein